MIVLHQLASLLNFKDSLGFFLAHDMDTVAVAIDFIVIIDVVHYYHYYHYYYHYHS